MPEAGAVQEATLDLRNAIEGRSHYSLHPLSRWRRLRPSFQERFGEGHCDRRGQRQGSVVAELEPICHSGGGHFVGSHPMAGAEKTGVGAARGDLFEKSICVVTPTRRRTAGAGEG